MNPAYDSHDPASDSGRRNGEPPSFDWTDKELFFRVQRDGDERAFEILYHRHAPSARKKAASCLNHSMDYSDAEDIVQEVFLQIWGKRSRLKCGNLPGLVVRIARFKAISLIRKQMPCVLCDPAEFDRFTGQPPTRCFMDWAEVLREMAPFASSEELLLLGARFIQGQTYAEIACRHGVSARTARRQIHKVLRKINEIENILPFLADSDD